jgi:cell division protein FtsI (penicillin-binding protein 3)
MSDKKKLFYENIIPRKVFSNKKKNITLTDASALILSNKNQIFLEKGKNKFFIFFLSILTFFFIVIFNLYSLSLNNSPKNVSSFNKNPYLKRGKIIDRNEKIISATISTLDLYIDPIKIINFENTNKILKKIFPQKADVFFTNLFIKNKYRLISTHLTKDQEYEIKKLGEPGLVFHKSEKRVYPHNNLFSQITGFMSRHQKPQSKLEKNYDYLLSQGKNLKLTVNSKIQNIVYQEIKQGMEKYNSKTSLGLLMDVTNGEIISMVSLPDFNPNHPSKIKAYTENNLVTNARFEMGSTLKMFNAAMAIENNSINKSDLFDVSEDYKLTNTYLVKDHKKITKPINFNEVFIESSNIGSIKVLEKTGVEKQKKFFYNLGFNERVILKGLSSIENNLPNDSEWDDVRSKSISYGYGISITPLSLVKIFSSLVNGGYKINPTIIFDEELYKERVLKKETSDEINNLLYEIVDLGTGKKASIKGLKIGGKTGTARKSKDKEGYYDNKIVTSFIGVFPVENPKYILFILFDDPKNENSLLEYYGGNTAAPIFSKIVEKISPILMLKKYTESLGEVVKINR